VSTPSVFRASALRAVDRLPVMSAVLHRALGLMARGDDVSIAELGVVIEEDAVVTGSLMSIANSALYSRANSVASVRHAIARLGVHKTRNVLLGLTASRCFNSMKVPEPWSSIRFNAHSLASAILSDLIVQRVPSGDPEWAFMVGLLHDIGLPLIAVSLPKEFRAITMDADNDLHVIEREREILGFTHYDLGAEVLARWNCPVMVQEAVRFCECTDYSDEHPLILGAAVKSATLLADANGISILASSEDSRLATELLDGLDIAGPMQFIETFRSEYNLVQGCVV
jgi:HD-like signal output (HDOD) protein